VSGAHGRYRWLRVVDFTPSCSIGHSSALCLELPHEAGIPKCPLYQENEGQFVLQEGSNFSCNSGLVPIVIPPPAFNLPYKILFKINSLVQHGCLPGPAIDNNFCRLVDPKRVKLEYIERALENLYHLKDCCYEPVRWLSEQYKRYAMDRQLPTQPTTCLDDGLVYVHMVQITPSRVYFCGPEVSLSNRVLRNYPEDIDNFLRVSFVDEDLDKLHSTVLSPRASSANEDDKRTSIYERMLSTLRNGIVIGDKKFEFLAFSDSQLHENSLWMFASRNGLTAADIREWMGDFRGIRNVAKLGQSFSSSWETVDGGRHEIEMIPDVEAKRLRIKYCFSNDIDVGRHMPSRIVINKGLGQVLKDSPRNREDVPRGRPRGQIETSFGSLSQEAFPAKHLPTSGKKPSPRSFSREAEKPFPRSFFQAAKKPFLRSQPIGPETKKESIKVGLQEPGTLMARIQEGKS
jgi:RNA-dependent RNA polymerase